MLIWVYICRGKSCARPIVDVDELESETQDGVQGGGFEGGIEKLKAPAE
jgi:hypothetical protein